MKEAICKNCGHGRNGHVDKWGGICVGCPCPGFEPVDAAESLPAAPEQEMTEAELDAELRANGIDPHELNVKMLNRIREEKAAGKSGPLMDEAERQFEEAVREHPRADCEGCNKPDCPCNSGEGDEGWAGMFSNNSVEPVAPVDAKEKCQYCGHVLSPLGNCSNCEEPKPTPSSVDKFFGTWPGDETDKELLASLDEIRKPQPDSSISTAPEHLVSNQILDGIIEGKITGTLRDINSCLEELQQWRELAKGQSNGR